MGGDFSSKGKQDCSKGIYVLAGSVSLMKAAVIHSVPKKEDTCFDPGKLVLALESWHKGISAPSFRSLMVDEERMTPGRWWNWCFVTFSALTMLDGWQEGHLACTEPVPLNPELFSKNKWRRKIEWELSNPGLPGKWPLKRWTEYWVVLEKVSLYIQALDREGM